MKNYLIFGFFFISVLSCTNKKYSKVDYLNRDYFNFRWDVHICCCKFFTNDNSQFWKKDSLGLNGFRRTITPLILKECNLKNQSWKEMEIFYGKPNFILHNYFFNGKDAIILTYLTYLDVENEYEENPINSHKTQYYDIVISKKDSLILNTILKYQGG